MTDQALKRAADEGVAHTELRRVGETPTGPADTAVITPAPRQPLDLIPGGLSDDALDDLFNDMPV